MNTSALTIFQNVLEQEKNALDVLIHQINQKEEVINAATHLLMQTKGRVILSGMGKSGHVGKKIAATFASTGQPALFIHPSEASHGDLGMVTKDDTLFLLSNSGETKELHDLMYFGVRHHIPILALTGNKDSTISKLANVSLTLEDIEEACPMGLAPTTSTTLMMAIGDALAVVLLTWRGFTNKDFKKFHPGGKLGQQLQKVSDVMHTKNLPLIDAHEKMSEAIIKMTQGGFGCIGIKHDNTLIGMITDGDLRRHMSPHLMQQSVVDVMTPNPKTIPHDMLAAQGLNVMEEHAITAVFVLDQKIVVGLLHIHDLLRLGVA
ncbi:MAG: Arabinose 5-phosphate isomerase KdsD [Holosporales bacterium]